MSDTPILDSIKSSIVEDQVEEHIKAIINLGNANSDQVIAEGILKGLTGEHRTLQQDFIRALVTALVEYGNSPYFDARNEWAIRWAKRAGEIDIVLPRI